MNYKELTERLVNQCLRLGADAAEVYLQSSRSLSIRIRNGDIETVQESAPMGIGFRVIVDNRLGFSHCNDFSDRSLTNTIERAIAFARLTSPDDNNILPGDKGYTDIE